jgi:hypothetical protein
LGIIRANREKPVDFLQSSNEKRIAGRGRFGEIFIGRAENLATRVESFAMYAESENPTSR